MQRRSGNTYKAGPDTVPLIGLPAQPGLFLNNKLAPLGFTTTAQRCHVTQCPQEAPGLFKVARPKDVGDCTSRCPRNLSGMLLEPVPDWSFPPLSP